MDREHFAVLFICIIAPETSYYVTALDLLSFSIQLNCYYNVFILN